MKAVAADVKGLVVAHHMGTGKTSTALSILQRLKAWKQVVVYAPGTAHVWKMEARKLGLYGRWGRQYISHQDLFTWIKKHPNRLKNKILVVDEAHTLASFFDGLRGDDLLKAFEAVTSSKKVIMLTGTPAYNGNRDLRWLINLAAGYGVVPTLDSAFERKYYKKDIVTGITRTWLPLLLMNKFLFDAQKESIPWPLRMLITSLTTFAGNLALASAMELQFFKINRDVVRSKLGKYVSMYDPSGKDPNFPALVQRTVTVRYTAPQEEVLSQLLTKHVDIKAIDKVIPNDLKRASPAATALLSHSLLHPGGYVSAWFKHVRCLSNLSLSNKVPRKFEEVLKAIRGMGARRTVVYSNFWDNGARLFEAYLRKHNIPCKVLTPSTSNKQAMLDAFERGDPGVIILHPSMTEGLTIRGAHHLHILEPPEAYSKLQQLIGRVKRYQSHNALPVSQRKVTVFQYVTVPSAGLTAVLRRSLESVVSYLKQSWHIAASWEPVLRSNDGYRSTSPETALMLHLRGVTDLINAFKPRTVARGLVTR